MAALAELKKWTVMDVACGACSHPQATVTVQARYRTAIAGVQGMEAVVKLAVEPVQITVECAKCHRSTVYNGVEFEDVPEEPDGD